MCSTIRPLALRHYFGLFQRNHVCKAPTSTFHQNLELPGLLQPVSRSKGQKCARLSAPCHRHNRQSWPGSMNGCQQAAKVQLQFISVPQLGIYNSFSVLPLRLRLRLRLCLVRGLGLGLRGHDEENQLPWPGITPVDEGEGPHPIARSVGSPLHIVKDSPDLCDYAKGQ